ncbi:MAG: diguanylate cyclase [Syntrophales bacterium]|nr:diguanylate cyclase [Syntrophales bacterium]
MEKQQILIIDDDPHIRKTLSDILKIKGYEPLTAKNGTEGLEFLRWSSVNLVIIDLGLPDMSGLEVLKRVKTDHPSTEAIILTGNASLDSAIEATNKGAFSYLQKPFEIDQLILHIRHAIDKHGAEEKIVRHNLELEKINTQLREKNIELANEVAERRRAEQQLSEEVALKNFLLNLNEKAFGLTDKDLYDYVLDYVVRLTESTIGFLHLVSDDQKDIILTTWNTEALRNCTASYATHYPLEQAGNWADCVRFRHPIIYNDFSCSPNQKGLPEGHTPVRRLMNVPVVEGDKVSVIFGVGNKPEEYIGLDASRIQVVANDLQRIMAQRRAETALSSSEAYFRSLIENASDIITIVDGEGIIRYLSPSFEHVVWIKASSLTGGNIFKYVHPDDEPAAADVFARAVQNPGVTLSAELRMHHNDGSWHIFEIAVQNLLQNEAVKGIVINSHDITARRQAEAALSNSEQKLKAVLYGSPIPQFVIDQDHQVVYWNNALEEITGIRASAVIGTNRHWRAFYGTERPCLADLMVDGAIEKIPELYQGKYGTSKLVAGAYEVTDYFPMLGENGKWLFFTAVVIRDVNGQTIGALETIEDISERKQAEEEILTLSITDQLTGLRNRRGFITFADQQLKLSDRTKRGMLLFFADLDGMKLINDTLGHEEGDRALIEVATILSETFRSVDIIARMGGDEFAILAIDSTEANSEIFLKRLQERIDTHNQLENRRQKISISIGFSCYDPENPCLLDELMAHADKMMYEQKRIKKSYL